MNKLLGFITMLVLAFPALGCDKACQRDRIADSQSKTFPGYLSWKFCEDTKVAFIESDVPSLQSYRDGQLDTQHKGGMNNIKNFVEQRKEWLLECDEYMAATNYGRIFKDGESTEKLFAALDSVARELRRAINGVTYVANGEEDKNAIIGSRFDGLFTVVDNHKAVMMRQGQFVTN